MTRALGDEWALVDGFEYEQATGLSIVGATIRGDYASVLQDSACKSFFEPFASTVGTHTAGSPLSIASVNISNKGVFEDDEASLHGLSVAVAALHAFVQANWTGPDLDESLSNGVGLLRRIVPDAFPERRVVTGSSKIDDDNLDELEKELQRASLDALTYAGEPAYHLCQAPFLLLFSLRLLDVLPADRLITLPLWRLRAFSIHSRLLDTPQPPPSALLAALKPMKARLKSAWRDEESRTDSCLRQGKLHARILVDEALSIQRAGRDRDANDLLLEAGKASELTFKVTGAPGKRTKFQREDKMILVLLARSAGGEQIDEVIQEGEEDGDERYDGAPSVLPTPSAKGWNAAPDTDQASDMPSNMLHNDDTLLERTRFTSSQGNDANDLQTRNQLGEADVLRPSVLHPLDSCILLGLCLNIHNSSPENGLTASQMNAFVNRVLAHARNWSVYTMALLLRSRLEADRTRTAQRSALQLQALLDQMPTADSGIPERLRFVHELELPSKWEMQAELARRYASLGVLRSALEIFERIELWQEVVQCWGALGRQDKGIEVVRELLQGSKDESDHVISAKRNRADHVGKQLSAARQANLWCLLGDLEVSSASEHYTKAWAISANRSARAARSLGGVAYAEADYVQASLWLRRALKIQPLYARSWFMLGCVYMRFDTIKAYVEAARCFRRCTALEDDDAESWNNLASCYLRLAQHSQGVLLEAQLAEEGEGQSDQRAVLQSLDRDDGTSDDQSDTDSLHSRDSGVAVVSDTDTESGEETETDEDDGQRRQRQARQASLLPSLSGAESSASGSHGAYDVKLLAHRALEKALRLAHDDWRVWNNFMIVSVDCGLMNDAVRSLARVVELRSKASAGFSESETVKLDTTGSGQIVDIAVLNRIVDAVIRAPSDADAVLADGHAEPEQTRLRRNPNEGHGLWPSVRNLFENTLIPRISSSASADIWRCYARLLLWRCTFRAALNAHLSAWQASYGAESSAIDTDREQWLRGMEALQELCELMENFGERDVYTSQGKELDVDEVKTADKHSLTSELAMANWRFRARSLVRTFIGRTRDAFETDQEWAKLVELRESLSISGASA